jgi:probable phosphoglycerate mutase
MPICLGCIARLLRLRASLWLRTAPSGYRLMTRLMDNTHTPPPSSASHAGADARGQADGEGQSRKRFLLVRHGEATFNVERRLPGQLPGVALTDNGRLQAQRVAIALSGLPLSAVISSPLERARDTAEVIARGWGLPVQLDPALMDTDVGRWSGRLIDEVARGDPEWKAFVEHPTEAPEGVESWVSVKQRAVAVIERARYDPALGEHIVVVAHADVVKLIVAHYVGIHLDCARTIHTDNGSVTSLSFDGERPPTLLALNWTPTPGWLIPWSKPQPSVTPAAAPAEQATDGTVAIPSGTHTFAAAAPDDTPSADGRTVSPRGEPRAG